MNGVLLVEVTLKIHVGKGDRQLLLDSDQVDAEVLVAESLLKGEVGSIRSCLDISFSSSLDVVKIVVSNRSSKLLPCNLTRNILDMITVDLSRVLTLDGLVTLLWRS